MTQALEAVDRWAAERGSAVAVAAAGREVTYAELSTLARRQAALLHRRGLASEARLAIVAADPIETLTVALGAQALNAATLLLNPTAPDGEAGRLVEQFGGEAVLRGEELTTVAVPRRPDPALLDPGPALALATSGVSGRPRIAQRDWRSVAAGAAALAARIGVGPGDVLVCTAPVHHAYAFVAGMVGCLLSGATYVAPRTPPSPTALAELCERRRATVLFSVPALYRWYLEGPPLARLRVAVSAGERLPPELGEAWRRRHGRPLCNHYGSTELGMLTFEPEGLAGSAGLPLEGVRLRIAAPAGERGEAIVEPIGEPALILDCVAGRRRDSRAPRAFRPGDLGRLGDDGRLYLEGRVGETIDLGGRKVVPAEVEEAIRRYEPVADACVLCVPDGDGVARICAFVQADGGFDATELRTRLLAELAPFKVPSMVRRIESIPRTSVGKLQRARLLDLATTRAANR